MNSQSLTIEHRFTVDVCVCTYRREHIALTLQSLAQMQLPEHCTLRIIVADNDATPSAQVLVRSLADALHLDLIYLHAPQSNISVARNACLNAATADYIAFIDDDETVSRMWLCELIATMRDTHADVVLGPMRAIYPEHCPRWLREGDFHSLKPVWVNETIITGYSGNVLMQSSSLAILGLRFRMDLGVSGGEDSAFFSRARKAGATIAFSPNAVSYEDVPASRANLGWLLRRRFRYGRTHAMIQLETGMSVAMRLRAIVITTAKILACCGMSLLMMLHPVKKRYWLLRGTLHLGALYDFITSRHHGRFI